RSLCVGRWPGWALRLAAPLFRFEPPFARRLRRLRRDAPPRDLQRLPQRLDETLDRELAVSELASLVLRDGAEHGPGLRHDEAFLGVRERVRRLHLEDRFDASL